MDRKYQVIRLNIEPPVEHGEGVQVSDTAVSGQKDAMFCEAYLKEEFLRFYDSSLQAQQAAAQAQQQNDPAF